MMPQIENDCFGLASVVLATAKSAGGVVMEFYDAYRNGKASVGFLQRKNDNSPLTLADLESHRLIAQSLSKLTPLIPIVSEEDETVKYCKEQFDLFWLVDPLDGTKEFISRNGEFTINIALISNGSPVWGCVYAPAVDCLYFGGRSFGSFLQRDGRTSKLSVRSLHNLTDRFRVVASKNHLNIETSTFIQKLGYVDLVQAGSSLKFCRVAEGSADLYPRLAPTCEWDTAAGQAVVEGAGGVVHDLQGNPLAYGKSSVINPSFIAGAQLFLGS